MDVSRAEQLALKYKTAGMGGDNAAKNSSTTPRGLSRSVSMNNVTPRGRRSVGSLQTPRELQKQQQQQKTNPTTPRTAGPPRPLTRSLSRGSVGLATPRQTPRTPRQGPTTPRQTPTTPRQTPTTPRQVAAARQAPTTPRSAQMTPRQAARQAALSNQNGSSPQELPTTLRDKRLDQAPMTDRPTPTPSTPKSKSISRRSFGAVVSRRSAGAPPVQLDMSNQDPPLSAKSTARRSSGAPMEMIRTLTGRRSGGPGISPAMLSAKSGSGKFFGKKKSGLATSSLSMTNTSWSQIWDMPTNAVPDHSGADLAFRWLAEEEQLSLPDAIHSMKTEGTSEWGIVPRQNESEEATLTRCMFAMFKNLDGLSTFTDFLISQFGVENMLFYQTVVDTVRHPTSDKVQQIWDEYMGEHCPSMVNISGDTRNKIAEGMERMNATGTVGRELTRHLVAAQHEIFNVMADDLFARFLTSDESATWKEVCKKAAETYRQRFTATQPSPSIDQKTPMFLTGDIPSTMLHTGSKESLPSTHYAVPSDVSSTTSTCDPVAVMEDTLNLTPARPALRSHSSRASFSSLSRFESVESVEQKEQPLSCRVTRSHSVAWTAEKEVLEKEEEKMGAIKRTTTQPVDIPVVTIADDGTPSETPRSSARFHKAKEADLQKEKFFLRRMSATGASDPAIDLDSDLSPEVPISRSTVLGSTQKSKRKLQIRKTLHEIGMASPEDLNEVLKSNTHLVNHMVALHEALVKTQQEETADEMRRASLPNLSSPQSMLSTPTQSPDLSVSSPQCAPPSPQDDVDSQSEDDDGPDSPRSRIRALRARRSLSIKLMETPRAQRQSVGCVGDFQVLTRSKSLKSSRKSAGAPPPQLFIVDPLDSARVSTDDSPTLQKSPPRPNTPPTMSMSLAERLAKRKAEVGDKPAGNGDVTERTSDRLRRLREQQAQVNPSSN